MSALMDAIRQRLSGGTTPAPSPGNLWAINDAQDWQFSENPTERAQYRQMVKDRDSQFLNTYGIGGVSPLSVVGQGGGAGNLAEIDNNLDKWINNTNPDLPTMQMSQEERARLLQQMAANPGADYKQFMTPQQQQVAQMMETFAGQSAGHDGMAKFLQAAMLSGFGAIAGPSLGAGGAATTGGATAPTTGGINFAAGTGAPINFAAGTGAIGSAPMGLAGGLGGAGGGAGLGALGGTAGSLTPALNGIFGAAGAAADPLALSFAGAGAAAPTSGINFAQNVGGTGPSPMGLADPISTGPVTGAEFGAGASGVGAAGAAGAGAGAGGGGSVLSRLLGIDPDLASVGGMLGSTALGLYGQNQQNDALSANADKYLALGAPSRARLEASYAPGFSMADQPDFQNALDIGSQSILRKLSADGGNPYGNPGAMAEANKYVSGSLVLPQLNAYRSQLGTFGQLGTNTAGANDSAAAQGVGNYGDIGLALGTLTGQKSPYEGLMKMLLSKGNSF